MNQPALISDLPDYIDPELWEAFEQHRKEIRHKLTPTTKRFLLKKLAKFHLSGFDVNACIIQSIENGWQGVFEHAQANKAVQRGNGQRETAVQRSERIEQELLTEVGYA